MATGTERKVVLVTRHTRLEELIVRHHTPAQAKFYIEHLGADFSDYLQEQSAYTAALRRCMNILNDYGRYQVIDRSYLTNFIFAEDDVVVALGQDGLVANTMKYLEGQPLIGLNPEPKRWDGVLAPFKPEELGTVLDDVVNEHADSKSVTMAQATLSDGQVLRAVNDIFVGPRSHTSALYDIAIAGKHESQSSSGVIIATGLGSTAWLKSIVTGSVGIAAALQSGRRSPYLPIPWDTDHLTFAVREPFPTKASGTQLVYGEVTDQHPLTLRSRMPEHGVIFSDGMESDFLRFTAGMTATVEIAPVQGRLVMQDTQH
jgi:NAD kinase